jgi:hypothetical protein
MRPRRSPPSFRRDFSPSSRLGQTDNLLAVILAGFDHQTFPALLDHSPIDRDACDLMIVAGRWRAAPTIRRFRCQRIDGQLHSAENLATGSEIFGRQRYKSPFAGPAHRTVHALAACGNFADGAPDEFPRDGDRENLLRHYHGMETDCFRVTDHAEHRKFCSIFARRPDRCM